MHFESARWHGHEAQWKMMFPLFLILQWRLAIFSKKVGILMCSAKHKVKCELKFSNEVWFILSKIFPARPKLMFLSVIGRRVVQLDLGIVSSLKLLQIEEDSLAGEWEIIDLQK